VSQPVVPEEETKEAKELLGSPLGNAEAVLGSHHNVAGWTIRKTRKGYYEAVKRIDGKLRSIYVGKDPSRAKEKIDAWENSQPAPEPHERIFA
jgi:hypothetical protein